MRLAYLDTSAGISGDMLLGAFVHAGVPVGLLRETLARLNLGATLETEEVDRSGIHSVKVHILTGGHPAEEAGHSHGHHHHDHGHSHGPHGHDHEVRSLSHIRRLIMDAHLPAPVEELALRTFQLLGEAEARIHHVPLESIHFHEVGAVDSIADIVLAAASACHLGIDAWHCAPPNVGSGTVECAHGRYPVPAPATMDLLRGLPTWSSGVPFELVTPTGAALLRALGCVAGPAPLMQVEAIGYGAGTRNPKGFANVLRLSVGPAYSPEPVAGMVTVLEAAVDDLNPQVTAWVTEQALRLGALDVMCTPVQMKKGRSGTLLTLLCHEPQRAALEQLLLRETSTLGIRVREERRICLERRHVTVQTEWGAIRIKVGHRGGEEYNVAPEFEDCRQAAEAATVPLKRVMEAALQAYRKSLP